MTAIHIAEPALTTNDDEGREKYWRRAMAESQRLGDEFLKLVSNGGLQDRVKPI